MTALLGAGLLWTLYALGVAEPAALGAELGESLLGTAQIVLFLLGAMTIVEVVDAHDGFEAITSRIRTRSLPALMWLVGDLLQRGKDEAQSRHLTLVHALGRIDVIVIGLVIAVVDNVPLVAAAMGMYDLGQYPPDHFLWGFLAYCAGTGGSILIIGSAAGVAAMGLEKIDFLWYLRRISLLALLGYLAGAGVYLLQHALLAS